MSQQRAGAEKKHLNDGIDLGRFDYEKMRGEMYNAYIDLVEGKVLNEDDPHQRRGGGLNGGKTYMFEVWDVTPHSKRLYPRSTTDKTMVPDGFELKRRTPHIPGTMITLKMALELNAMLYAKIGGFNNNPIYYYLLQKPTNDAKSN